MLFRIFSATLLLLLVKNSNSQWLNCSQVDFCERLRYQPRNSICVLHSLSVHRNSITALIETDTNSSYNFTLNIIAGGTFRITIDDVFYPRHRVLDVLDGEPQKSDLNVTKGEGIYIITSNDARVLLFPDTLLINFYWKENLVAVIDSDRLVLEDKPYEAVTLEIFFPGAQRAYGLPEHADHFSLRETVNITNPYRLYNIDNYGYDTESTQALYGSVPVLYAHSVNYTSGVFWQNSAQTFVDIQRRYGDLYTYFMSESGAIDFFIFGGPTLKDAVRQYANLTGNSLL